MSPPEAGRKRGRSTERDKDNLSPPPAKRKFQSTTNQNKVASFFTPASQKTPDKTTWRTIKNSLLIARYEPSKQRREKRRKIAAFDLDSTLITSASGKKFSTDGRDWKWWHPSVPGELRELDQKGYQLVVLSNQNGISLSPSSQSAKVDAKRVAEFKTKVSAVFNQLDLAISVYAATEKDHYRKPRTGMWSEMLEDYDLDAEEGPNLGESHFVGDAGGRVWEGVQNRKSSEDFSCSDRDFAANVGIMFITPEQFFLKEPAMSFKRKFDPNTYFQSQNGTPLSNARKFVKEYDREIVVFCGSPGSGKSTFFWKRLAPLGYERVNQDILKTRDKCLDKASTYLSEFKPVVVDNTNADVKTRSYWLILGKQHKLPVRCVYFKSDPKLCEHNDAVRALGGSLMNPEARKMLPKLAFTSFASRFQEPTIKEGFEEVMTVDFAFDGTDEERRMWSKYWI